MREFLIEDDLSDEDPRPENSTVTTAQCMQQMQTPILSSKTECEQNLLLRLNEDYFKQMAAG